MKTFATRRLRFGRVSIVTGLALLFAGIAVGSAEAAPTPSAFTGNPKLSDLGFSSSFKIDEQPTAKVYDAIDPLLPVETEGTIPEGLEIAISNVVVDDVNKTVTFDWAASIPDGDDDGDERDPFLIYVVLVKFADGGLRYDYPTGASSDTGLYATKDSISHVDFGWGLVVTTSSSDDTTSSSTPTTLQETTTSVVVEDTQVTQATVKGVVIERQLPRTGATTVPLAEAGGLLVLVGIALLRSSHKLSIARAS